MIVYHGGYCEIRTPEIKPSRNNKDFDPGFYCTELFEKHIAPLRRYPFITEPLFCQILNSLFRICDSFGSPPTV
ncbi:DUF3990 domain-containing protein [bacterium]|nr:DUF3990 domain-containing protein [bacterium]